MKTIELFQWDLNKQIPCSFPEAHFACVGSEDALIVKANGGNAQIPNILLQEGKDIMVWMMEDGAVADSGRIRIVTRAKPADYVYTESEVITFESLVAKVEDVIAKGNTAADSATTAAQKADAAANKANAASDKAAQVEAEIKASEARRVEAEQGRAEAEVTRAAHESKRTESFNTNLVSWNSKVDAACKKATDTASKAAQDAKTATDAAIAKTEEATNAAVAKAQTATDNATTAANKAEAAVSKLPLPLGNTLKGEVESTMVSVHDAYPAPLVTTKVMGQSNQLTTTGKNLFNWDLYIGDYAFDTSASGQGFYYAKFQVGAGKTVAVSVDKVVTSGEYLAFADGKFSEKKKVIWLAHSTAAVKNGTLTPDAEGNVWIWFGNSKQNIQRLYDTGVKVQVEIGTKATAWEPYTGGKPSPSPDYPQEITNLNKAELVVAGKNLLNPEFRDILPKTFKGITFADNGDGGIKVSGKAETIVYLNYFQSYQSAPTLPAGSYTASFKSNSSNIYMSLAKYVNANNFESLGKAFTLSDTTAIRLYIAVKAGAAVNEVVYPMITGSISNNSFQPYEAPIKTPINLKGNELCSLPNGVKDEVVIDAEGNVSLIKRVGKYDLSTVVNMEKHDKYGIQSNMFRIVINGAIVSTLGNTANNISCNCLNPNTSAYVYKNLLDNYICGLDVFMHTKPYIAWGVKGITTVEAMKVWLAEHKPVVLYGMAEPQIIQLGKVELPALPEATSNVWNDGNIPANVYINYLKDVNIAYTDLENQIKQITAALSVMDTPTIIPEMAWGTPAAI